MIPTLDACFSYVFMRPPTRKSYVLYMGKARWALYSLCREASLPVAGGKGLGSRGSARTSVVTARDVGSLAPFSGLVRIEEWIFGDRALTSPRLTGLSARIEQSGR